MASIKKADIPQLVQLFERRSVGIYHACQYKDFKTYLELGGIPSRNLIESSKLPYTPFDTDAVDKQHELWTRVFGNLSDFGFFFAYGARKENTAPIPNPYGPILLALAPESMNDAEDMAVCLRSAGSKDFNREAEALPVKEVDRVFKHPVDEAPNEYAKGYIKFQDDLRKEFHNKTAMSPEISFTVSNERLSLAYLDRIIVDPYDIGGQNLLDKVTELKEDKGLPGVVWQRKYVDERFQTIQELAERLLKGGVTLQGLIKEEVTSQELKDYATRLSKGGMAFQFDRFARYLQSGTLLELGDA